MQNPTSGNVKMTCVLQCLCNQRKGQVHIFILCNARYLQVWAGLIKKQGPPMPLFLGNPTYDNFLTHVYLQVWAECLH